MFKKPGLTKVSQIVLVGDVRHVRPFAYRHSHKLHVKPPGCTVWGKIQVKEIIEVMNLIAEGEGGGREINIA